MFKRFPNDRRGATAIEYGLIIACLSLTIIGGVQLFGNSMQARFVDIATFLDNTNTPD